MRSSLLYSSALGLFVLVSACKDRPTESAAQQALGSNNCELVVNDAGMLPACAAGTSSKNAPGKPFDFQGDVEGDLPLSPSDQANTATADLLAASRNSPSQSPIDRGFGTNNATPTPKASK